MRFCDLLDSVLDAFESYFQKRQEGERKYNFREFLGEEECDDEDSPNEEIEL